MSSTNKTTNYELNQWVSTDKPQMQDFNNDNLTIDTELGQKANTADVNAALALKANVTNPVIDGTVKATGGFQPYDSKVLGTISGYAQPSEPNETNLTFNAKDINGADAGFVMRGGGAFFPVQNNHFSFGAIDHRLTEIYAVNGTINTSDATEKSDIEPLAADKANAFLMAIEPVSYKFTGGKRTHYGMTAQQVKAAMDSAGLTDMDFAGWVKSPVVDREGKETGEFGYGLRYHEFIPLMLKVIQEQQKRIDALEAKLNP